MKIIITISDCGAAVNVVGVVDTKSYCINIPENIVPVEIDGEFFSGLVNDILYIVDGVAYSKPDMATGGLVFSYTETGTFCKGAWNRK